MRAKTMLSNLLIRALMSSVTSLQDSARLQHGAGRRDSARLPGAPRCGNLCAANIVATHQDDVAAALAFELHLPTRAQDKPLLAAARVWFF